MLVLTFSYLIVLAGYPKNMTGAHLNPYPATILGLQKLFTQQEKVSHMSWLGIRIWM